MIALAAALLLLHGSAPASGTPSPSPLVVERDGGAGGGATLTMRFGRGLVEEVVLEQAAAPRLEAPFPFGRRRCEELCRSGLGGTTCGPQCTNLLPTAFTEILINLTYVQTSATNNTQAFGHPRFGVCDDLCKNSLGDPICGCLTRNKKTTNWPMVCQTFCDHGSYRLDGCPPCRTGAITAIGTKETTSYLFNQDIWVEWCNYQCSNGDGGAACNCDLAPLSVLMKK